MDEKVEAFGILLDPITGGCGAMHHSVRGLRGKKFALERSRGCPDKWRVVGIYSTWGIEGKGWLITSRL